MDLRLPAENLSRYKSLSQQARVCTEPWGLANLYCPACESPSIDSLPTNTPAHDFKCPACYSWFQLKSKATSFGRRIQDGAFAAMKRAILADRTPNLFLLQYSRPELIVVNVLLFPNFVFTESILEKRKPLSPKAKRAGWVGCNFLIDQIPSDARITIVEKGVVMPAAQVRTNYAKLRPLENLETDARGWTLDVLKIVRSLGTTDFSLADVYAREDELAKIHPGNRHVRDKIRQQLQVLRDFGLLSFLSPGNYRLR